MPAQPRRKGRVIIAIVLLLLIAAMIGGGWLAWRQGWLKLQLDMGRDGSPVQSASAPQAGPQAVAALANAAATDAALASAAARVSALEQRLAELNQQALAASGQATHAEALLVAFAARRALDRGQPLGYLESELRVRFGDSQPGAVDRVIGAAAKPVTLASLSEEFARIEPQLEGAAPNEGGWDWLARQMGNLFVIRHDDQSATAGEDRLARTRAAIAGGRIDMAIADVEQMPGRAAATEWLAHARDWTMTQHALDQLETTALALPVATPAGPVATPAGIATSAPITAAPVGVASEAP